MKILLKVLTLLVFICISYTNAFSQISVPGTDITIKSEHPRIWLDQTSKAALISDLSEGGRYRDYYLRIRTYVDGISTPPTGAAVVLHRYWLSVYLCAMVEGGSYLDRIRTRIADYWNVNSNSSIIYRENAPPMMALAYDWFFEELTTTEKQTLANSFVAWWDYWQSTSAYIHASWNNHTMEETQGFTFGPIAFYGDGLCDSEAHTAFIKAREWLFDEIIAATNYTAGAITGTGSEGGWAEGTNYWIRGGFAFLESLHCWTSATNENALENSICMSNIAGWLLHIGRNDNTYARFSNGHAFNRSITGSPSSSIVFYMLSKLYNDGYARYEWNRRAGDDGILSSSELSNGYAYLYTFYVLFNNNTDPIDINTETKEVYFEGMEMVTIHSDFNNDGNTSFIYKNNDMFDGHDHFDAGHFEISRDVGLAIDAGAYEGGDATPENHCWEFYQRTIAHNTITVLDPNETWYGRNYTNNDGGQKWPGDLNGDCDFCHHPNRINSSNTSRNYEEGGVYERGGITLFTTNDDYTYFKADLTAAYSLADGSDLEYTNSQKMKLFTREFAYLNKKYYVVFDNVISTNPTFKKRWLLHSVNEPQILNKSITMLNGNSVLYNNSLLPEGVDIIKRGGDGREFWNTYENNNGNNPSFTEYHGRPPDEPGAWRIEQSPIQNNEQDFFLNVLYPAANTVAMPSTALINSYNAEMSGSFINDSELPVVIMFNKTDSLLSSVFYSVNNTEPINHILTGFEQGFYFVMQNNSVIHENVPASEYGIITFSSENGGGFEITRDTTLTINRSGEMSLNQNVPNPFESVTEISIDNGNLEIPEFTKINIYSLEGKFIKSFSLTGYQYSVEWDASNCAAGVYVCRLLVGDKIIDSKKMVLRK